MHKSWLDFQHAQIRSWNEVGMILSCAACWCQKQMLYLREILFCEMHKLTLIMIALCHQPSHNQAPWKSGQHPAKWQWMLRTALMLCGNWSTSHVWQLIAWAWRATRAARCCLAYNNLSSAVIWSCYNHCCTLTWHYLMLVMEELMTVKIS